MEFLELNFTPQLKPDPSRISYVDGLLTLESPFSVEYDVYKRNIEKHTGWEYYDTTTSKQLDLGDEHMVRIVPEGWKLGYGIDLAFPVNTVNDNNPYYNSAKENTPSTYIAKQNEDSNWNTLLRGMTKQMADLLESSTQASLEHSATPPSFFEPWCDNTILVSEAEPVGDNYVLKGDDITLDNIASLDNVLPSRFTYKETIDRIPKQPQIVFEAPHLQFNTVNGNEYVKFYLNTGTNEIIGFLSGCGEVVYRVPLSISGSNIGFFYSPDMFFILQNDGLYYLDLEHSVDEQTPTQISSISTTGHYLIVVPGGFAIYDSGFKLYSARYDYYTIINDSIHVIDDYSFITATDRVTITLNPEHSLIWTSEDDRKQMMGLFRSYHQSLIDFNIRGELFLSKNATHSEESLTKALEAMGIDCTVISTEDLYSLTDDEQTAVLDAMDKEVTYSELTVINYDHIRSGLEHAVTDLTDTSQPGIIDILSEDPIPKVIYGADNPVIVSDKLQIESFSGTTHNPEYHVADTGIFVYGTSEFIKVPQGDENKYVKLSGNTLTANEDQSGLEISYIKDNVVSEATLSFSPNGDVFEATVPDYDRDLVIQDDLYLLTDEILYSFDGKTVNFSESATGYIVYDTSDELSMSNIKDYVFGLLEADLKPEIVDADPSYTLEAEIYREDGYLYLNAQVKDNDVVVPARGTIEVDNAGSVKTLSPLLYGPLIIDENPQGDYSVSVDIDEVYPFAGTKTYVSLQTTLSGYFRRDSGRLHKTYLPLEFDAV